MKKISLIFTLIIAIIFSASAQTSKSIHLKSVFHITSASGWDYLEIGPINDRLYVSHGNQVNILNKISGDSIGVIENTKGVHGIAFDVANNEGFTSNGALNNVTVFDIKSNKIITQIPTGQNPDAIFYEPFSKKIITCNGRSKSLSIIDAAQNKVVDSVYVGGKPETAVSDGKGKIFVNVEDKNEIVQIDAKTFKVLNHWSIKPGQSPTGLAIDTKTNRLFAGCEKLLLVIDAVNGKVIDKITIGDGCDGVAFDDVTKNIYTSNGEGTLSVIHEENANKYVFVSNVVTKKSARTLILDKKSHLIYLPAAEFDATLKDSRGRAMIKPGSFQILVFGK